jgi:anthranilate synthase component 1
LLNERIEMNKMKKYILKSKCTQILADTLTPVGIYLALRDKFPYTILLESSDYHGNEHTFSYICFDKMAGFKVDHGVWESQTPNGETHVANIQDESIAHLVTSFIAQFQQDDSLKSPFLNSGFFGFMTYDAVQYVEDIQFRHELPGIPELQYNCYKNIIAFNHFNNELYLIQHCLEGETQASSEHLLALIQRKDAPVYPFKRVGEKTSNLTDSDFLEMVNRGIKHCYRGDIFQIVLSRQFNQAFEGDDFNAYRALRAINPSPYLFYFDMGGFRIFGSSPEAQIIIKEGNVTIHPIAGTFRRTGNDAQDAALAQKLSEDPKENAEHIMLVDLARNDLSRHGTDVKVEVYREVQYYSHVLHLVSKVTAKLQPGTAAFKVVGDTFPAGTLSGAPKYRAMELIDEIENSSRGFYGGAIGHMSFNGDYNHAIMIRSFLSKDNSLRFQAGAGVVADSVPASELQEVENKLMALNRALILAETL